MNVTSTISTIELIWTLSAIPGAYFWFRNWYTARCALKAAQRLGITNGRIMWARFSMMLTATLTGVELVFIMIGAIAMSRESSPSSTLIGALLIAGGLTACSIAITYIAIRWRTVDEDLIKIAREEQRRRPR